MSLRALWIFDSRFNLLFSRKYPNVEKKAHRVHQERHKGEEAGFVGLPPNDQFLNQLRISLQSAGTLSSNAVFHVASLAPVVLFNKDDLSFACLPFIAAHDTASLNTFDLPEITVALAFLKDLATFFQQLLVEMGNQRDLPMKLAELNSYINYALPFGSYVSASLADARLFLKTPFPEKPAQERQPAWKPYLHRGKPQIQFVVRERLQAMQYDKEDTPDTLAMTGSILCKAELEGIPDVTLGLNFGPQIGNFALHPCVHAAELSSTRKLVFSPPLDLISLCDFQVKSIDVYPLRGFYQMKEIDDHSVKVLVQLKLHESVNNNFEYCQLRMPFSNRGVITNAEVTPTSGVISVSGNRKMIVWNIGPKFLGRNREAALPGTVYFLREKDDSQNTTKTVPYRQLSTTSDSMCVGQTAYVSLHFKVLDDSLSKLTLDSQNLVVYPNQKPKVTVAREIEAGEYLIWNSLGNVRSAHQPASTRETEANGLA